MADKKQVVLVVEDELPLLEAIITKLGHLDFDVVSATNVDQAINQLKDVKKIDLVWLDHYLPEKPGTALVAYMKKEGSPYKDIPIFLVSNTASLQNIYDYVHLGIEKYFVKADRRLDEIIADIKLQLHHD
jgi:CheY-like chemotaxis protein